MKIIPPYQISSEILSLINQAEKYIVLVSPYVDFKKWGGLKQELEKAKQRGILIEFIARFEPDNYKSWEQIEAIGITPKLVKNLHAKLYYNEKNGIVTSMNLLTSSNLSAIEFGTIYNTKEEIQELKYYVKQFLIPHVEDKLPSEEDLYLAKEKFLVVLKDSIYEKIGRYPSCRFENGEIKINAKNQFYLGIDKVQKGLYLYGILNTYEANESEIFIKNTSKKLNGYSLFLDGGVMMIESKKTFTSDNFNFLKIHEKKEITQITSLFIELLLVFKEECYQKKKESYK